MLNYRRIKKKLTFYNFLCPGHCSFIPFIAVNSAQIKS